MGRVHDSYETTLARYRAEPVLTSRIQVEPPVSYADVTAEIDSLDIALAPAGDTAHSNRYRSPLKLFDYMARGKPIVASDVSCHREVLQDGFLTGLVRVAWYYRSLF